MLKAVLKGYENTIYSLLSKLYSSTSEYKIKPESPIIIFSDLHMGNGTKKDDFKNNSDLFTTALREYYLAKNYTLILNGDIEELQKFELKAIEKAWEDLYRLFDRFNNAGRFIKITGNHDKDLTSGLLEQRYKERKSVRLRINGFNKSIFVYHGHQASLYYHHLNRLNTFLLRYIVNPLGIKNFSKKIKHKKKIRIENRSYRFARKKGIISIIGHTHRPLFESFSYADTLRFAIENNLRAYHKADESDRKAIAKKIKKLKKKYDKHAEGKAEYEPAPMLYSTGIPVPCLFNSGCTIGKRGITGIEITTEKIALIHWFDSRISSRFLKKSGFEPEPLKDFPHIYRLVLKEDWLDYIYDSIRLLSSKTDT